MRALTGLPLGKVTDEFLAPESLAEMLAAAEASRFDAISVTDHPAPPVSWLESNGHQAQDPFVMLGFAAAVTRRLRLATGLLVLPYRNPIIAARAVSSLDILSNGRLILGVGRGYLEDEYAAVGADFERRNEIMEEHLAALVTALSKDEFDFEGRNFTARRIRIEPRGRQAPHAPVWVGGNARISIRWAVDYAQGWMPFTIPAPVDGAPSRMTVSLDGDGGIAAGIAYMRDYAEKVGKPPLQDIAVEGFKKSGQWNAQEQIDYLSHLGGLGATWARIHLPSGSRSEWIEAVDRHSREVLSRLDG